MIVKLEPYFRKLEKQRKNLFKQLDQLSEEQLQYKPDANSWSIVQVCWHLIKAEENSAKYMRKKLKGLDKIDNAGLGAKMRLKFLNSLVGTKIKFKAPKVVELKEEETAGLSYADIKENWDRVRSDLQFLADKLDHKASEKMIFKHPILGRFNIYQAFSFMETHVGHHLHQIDRIKASPGFPK